jgi:hypothetical protein
MAGGSPSLTLRPPQLVPLDAPTQAKAVTLLAELIEAWVAAKSPSAGGRT